MSGLFSQAPNSRLEKAKTASFLLAWRCVFSRRRPMKVADLRMLRDIGVTQGETMDDVDRPFWIE